MTIEYSTSFQRTLRHTIFLLSFVTEFGDDVPPKGIGDWQFNAEMKSNLRIFEQVRFHFHRTHRQIYDPAAISSTLYSNSKPSRSKNPRNVFFGSCK